MNIIQKSLSLLSRRRGQRPKLFLSYRRRTDSHLARLLKDGLTEAFGEGSVFRDVDDIAPGDAFPESISKAVESCDVFIPVVSPGWVESLERLRDPSDFARREIAAALARGAHVIPVLVGGARMPAAEELPEELRDLAFRQALELSDERWDYDVARLVGRIRERAARPLRDPSAGRDAARTPFDPRLFRIAAALLVAAPLAVAAYLYYTRAVAPPARVVSYDECLKLIRVFGHHESRVKARVADAPLVGIDEYGLASDAPPEGLLLLVRLSDSGREVGAVAMRYFRGQSEHDRKFVVELAVEPPCVRVEGYSNVSKPAYARTLTDWDTLRVPLQGREYFLRVGDHGDSLIATLTPDAPQ